MIKFCFIGFVTKITSILHLFCRYTKALEVIKKLHKDQAQEIKTYKLKLENLQTLKDAAYKVLFIFIFLNAVVDKTLKMV